MKETAKGEKEARGKKTAPSDGVFYCKEQILKFEQYRNRRDLLGALLQDGKSYTKSDVEAEIKRFMEGKVR